MSEAAQSRDERCPCGGTVSPTDQEAIVACEDCGRRAHRIAVRHADLLEDLADAEDDAIADLAETILAYDGGER